MLCHRHVVTDRHVVTAVHATIRFKVLDRWELLVRRLPALPRDRRQRL